MITTVLAQLSIQALWFTVLVAALSINEKISDKAFFIATFLAVEYILFEANAMSELTRILTNS